MYTLYIISKTIYNSRDSFHINFSKRDFNGPLNDRTLDLLLRVYKSEKVTKRDNWWDQKR